MFNIHSCLLFVQVEAEVAVEEGEEEAAAMVAGLCSLILSSLFLNLYH